MEDILLTAPPGFIRACHGFNTLLSTNPEHAAHIVSYAVKCGDLEGALTPPPSTSAPPKNDALKLAFSALQYIYDGAKRGKVEAKPLATGLSLHTDLSTEAIECIVRAYMSQMSQQPTAEQTTRSTNSSTTELLGVDWAIGVTTKTAQLPSIADPFVKMRFRTRQPDGTRDYTDAHLTILQLSALEASLRDAAMAIERA